MQTQRPKYRLYPSLLDAFQGLLDYEDVANEPWNKVSEAAHTRGEYLDKEVGEYILTPDEMFSKLEQDLIDTVNRVDGEPSEAADRGTCFNEIVDCLIAHKPCAREDMEIHTLRDENDNALAIRAEMDGFTFDFDVALCKEAAEYFKDSLSQVLVEAPLETNYGTVVLYGYIDEWRLNIIYDIKTTGYYDFGKYARKWQKHVYPYCCITSGLTTEVAEFEYTVYKLTKPSHYNPVIRGTQYRESYTYDHDMTTVLLRMMCERFIEWLTAKADAGLITNKRIFNQ